MSVPDLALLASAAVDEALASRVRVACHLVGVPYSPEMTMHVAVSHAAAISSTAGSVDTSGITDEAIVAAVRSTTAGAAPEPPTEPAAPEPPSAELVPLTGAP